VELGTVGEIVNESAERRELRIGIETESARVVWRLNPEDRVTATALCIASVEVTDKSGVRSLAVGDKPLHELLPSVDPSKAISDLLIALRTLVFISAVRGGTQEVFASPETGEPVHTDVGTRGEFAPWWLARFSDEEVPEERRLPSERGATVRRQVGAWGSELFPGFEATAQFLGRTGLVQVQFRTRITEEWRRPSNVGYGLSYAFPILVAGLLAKRSQLIIVDSPEAHLHPRAQSRMGVFLATIAAAGVRVVIETHSDHVLNGIRLAVMRGTIKPEHVAIYFFTGEKIRDTASPSQDPGVLAAHVDAKGGISVWPAGFFDQAEKDMASLAGWAG
jgi:predicted ATPase